MLKTGKVCRRKPIFPMLVPIFIAIILGCSDHQPTRGTQLLIRADLAGIQSEAQRSQAMSSAESRIRQRLKKFYLPFSVEQRGTNFVVQIGTRDNDTTYAVIHSLQQNGFFEMRAVHPRSDDLTKTGGVPAGYEIAHLKVRTTGGKAVDRVLIITNRPMEALTSRHIKHAYAEKISKSTVINIEFDEVGAKALAEFTTHHIDDQLAMLLDRQVISAPMIRSPIPGGRFQIVGNFRDAEATAIANVLENPVEAPLQVNEIRSFVK